jgi:spermidine/putrescine transport system permease protein
MGISMKRYFSGNQVGIPYTVFLICFVIMPVLVLLYYAFTDSTGAFTVENFTHFFMNINTIGTLFYSVMIAFLTTVICLLIGYPVAYILARSELKKHVALLLLFIIPMWINFTLRLTALKEVLTVLEGNLAYYPFLNTIIAMTYDFLPFMIFPLYTVLLKMDEGFLEAASDLGATPINTFLKVTLPLSLPGIVSGVTMVFLPSMTNYVILDMMHNSTFIMGNLIGSYFNNHDWHNGSMISIILLGIILVSVLATKGFGEEKNSRGGVV